jgi:chorismate synthase
MLRYLTAGESHGKALVAILDGCPANLPLSEKDLNPDLARRQMGYGRGGRMKIEKDSADILSGVRKGLTIGSPIALYIPNRSTEFFNIPVTQLRPGHADLAGALKYDQADVRNILERASARETACRVAVGAIAKKLLFQFGIKVSSVVIEICGKKDKWKKEIDRARAKGDTVGGIFEVKVVGVPIGLGTYAQQDLRLDGMLAQAVMAIPAIKGVEIGLGFEAARMGGSEVHDPILYSKKEGWARKSNNAGGLEGGITNGEPIIVRAAMKPISTLLRPLASVDLKTRKPCLAHIERSDICAVEAAAVVGEAAVAIEIANAFLQKFGGDNLRDIKTAFHSYLKRVSA